MRVFKSIKLYAVFFVGALLMPTASKADITIAVVGGMEGPFEKIGNEFKQGVRGIVDVINENGGLLGQKVNIVVRADKCDVDEAVKIANELVTLKVSMVMGHLCSHASIAASVIYEKAGIIAISPSSTNPEYTERGLKYIFRTTGRDDVQGFVIAEHVIRSYKTKNIGIVYGDNTYSKGVAEITKKFLNQGGVQEVFYEKAPEEPFDFASVFALIKKNNTDVVIYPGLPGAIIAFTTQANEKDVKVRLIGSDAFSGIIFNDKNRRFLDGAQFSFPPDPKDDRRNKAIVKKYKAQGYKPEAFAFYSYGAVEVWAQAVTKAATLNADQVSQTLRSGKFETVLGKINFDEKGDISNPGFVMYFFNKGKRYYLD